MRFPILKITLRQLLRMPLYWIITLSGVILLEILPAFQVLHFGLVNEAILDALGSAMFFVSMILMMTCNYNLWKKELDEHIPHFLFTKPISRNRIILEKALALLLAFCISFLIQSIMLIKQGMAHEWTTDMYGYAFMTAYLVFIQSFMLLNCSVFLTLFLSSALQGTLLSFLLMIISFSLSENMQLALIWLIPPIAWLDPSPVIYFKSWWSPKYALFSLTLAVAYSAWCISMTTFVLNRKNL